MPPPVGALAYPVHRRSDPAFGNAGDAERNGADFMWKISSIGARQHCNVLRIAIHFAGLIQLTTG